MTWEDVVAYALTLPRANLTTHYGGSAVKANGHPLVTPSREEGSFCLHIDQDTKAILMETDPRTFWQTPHYDGWPSVLVRYGGADPERVRTMIERSHEWAMSRKPPRPRKK
jgi:hypothetical protein